MEWLPLLQNFGLAVLIIVFLGWAGVMIAPWIGRRIDRLVEYAFDATDKVAKFDERLSKIEERIENVWNFLLRRAQVEVVKAGVGKKNSPLVIDEEAKSWLSELADDLRCFYQEIGNTLTEAQLAEEIEKRWGQEIVDKICTPHGLFQGACLLIAMEVAKSVAENLEKSP